MEKPQWIKNWMDSHTQKVVINGSTTVAEWSASWEPAPFNIFTGDMTVGLSIPSVNLLMTPSSMVWLTYQRKGMPSRGTLTVLRGGPMKISCSSTKPSARSCTWIRAIPNMTTGQAENGLRAVLRRRTWWCRLIKKNSA